MFAEMRKIAKTMRRDFRVYRLALRDPRTPFLAKIVLGVAVGYAVLPFDIIPDFLPVIGHLDDIVIIPLLVRLALKMIPEEVIADARKRVNEKQNFPGKGSHFVP